MILSASRRTDIPAYYSEWLMNRLRAGYLLTRNPFNNTQIRRVELSPELIDCIVFWTKDPTPMLPVLDTLDAMGYLYYFQFTLTPYDNTIERNLRPKEEIVKTFISLSKRIGRNRVFWRYDPIILNDNISIDYHIFNFTSLCEKVSGYTPGVTISFVDMYRKVKTPLIREIKGEEISQISEAFVEIAGRYGLSVQACCEQTDLSIYGISPASCIDIAIVENLCGHKVGAKPDKHQRPNCGCVSSVDVGEYNTCKGGCVYCYANFSAATVSVNCMRHNPAGEVLTKK